MFLSKPPVHYEPLTYEIEVAAIREMEKGVKMKAQVANTLSTYLKNKEKILNSMENENGKTKKGQEDRKTLNLTSAC